MKGQINSRQIIVLWITGILLALGFVWSTYSISINQATTLDGLLNDSKNWLNWHFTEVHNPSVILRNLIRTIPPILIIGCLFVYSFKDKS